MVLSQSNYSQIESNQSFAILEDNISLQLKWKEVHKKKRKKFSHLYRVRLKKELKCNSLILKKSLKKSHINKFDNENHNIECIKTAHNDLFDKSKMSSHIMPAFYNSRSSKIWNSKQHIGYTSHGEILWKN